MKPILLPIGPHADLLYIYTDAFKSESLSVSLRLPLDACSTQENLMLLALSRRGTVSYPTLALLNKKLDDLYSTSVSCFNRMLGDSALLGFAADFLGARFVGGGKGLLPDVIALLAELLQKPITDENGNYLSSYVESEKNNLRDAIRAKINSPRAYATEKCRALLTAGEPYAYTMLGEEETVANITPASLMKRFLATKSQVSPLFCYVGETPAAEVQALLKDSFADFGSKAPDFATTVKIGEGYTEKSEEMPLCQGKLSIGFRSDISLTHPLAPALLVLNEIFGGSPASKLFLNVREKRSLCYHCSSSLDLFKGVLFANSGMKPQNRAVTEEAMLEQMADIAAGKISNEEFSAAKSSLCHSYKQLYDAPGVLSRFYINRRLLGLTDSLEEWRERVANTALPSVVEAAAHIHRRAAFFLRGTDSGEEGEE